VEHSCVTLAARKYRALVFDDDPRWRYILSKTLTARGLIVDVAGSPDECLKCLQRTFYHLAVFDISMTAGFDQRGLDLLLDLYETTGIDAMAVIVFSGYATIDSTTTAMQGRPNVRLYQKGEKFNNRQFADNALNLLRQAVPLNLDLDVVWQRGSEGEVGGLDVLVNLRVRKERVEKSTALFERVAGEFDDLLARMFNRASRLVLTPMRGGRSGAGVLKAQPFLNHGGGATVVLKFGDLHDIETENRNFDEYVNPYLNGARTTAVHKRAHTWLLGATAYRLLGAGEFVDFPTYYAQHSTGEVIHALDGLFADTCAPWYENAGPVELLDLRDEYTKRLGCDEENLRRALQNLKTVQGGSTLTFSSLSAQRKFPNPIRTVSDEQLVYSSHKAITHGDLNGGNIMVDRSGTCWLIDFYHTAPAHVLRDLTLLDGAIRWTSLVPADATLDERLALEEALLDACEIDADGRVKGRLDSDNPALRKAFDISLYLRSLAAKQNRKRNMNDVPDYALASMFYGLNLIRFLHLPKVQREHALLSAALTVERLRL
jgi:CheY-like chemotaxis protein